MKKRMCLSLLLCGWSAAVQVEPLMPLTSVSGTLKRGWFDPSMVLVVHEAGDVQIDLSGAQWSAGTPGDDRYGPGEVQTNFELLGEGVFAQTSYGTGKEDRATFFQGTLLAGTYHLGSFTSGQGKNSYRVWVSGNHLELRSNSLAFTSTSKEWTSVLRLSEPGTITLKLDDTESASELGVRFVSNGKVQNFPQVKNGMLVTVTGPGRLEVRQPERAQQKSNTFRFSAFRAGKPEPLEFAGGASRPRVLLEARVLVGGDLVPGPGKIKLGDQLIALAAGEKFSTANPSSTLQVLDLPGLVPVDGQVDLAGKTQVMVLYRPVLHTQVDSVSCVPQNGEAQWKVTLKSDVEQKLPVTLRVKLGDGLSTVYPDEISFDFHNHFQWVLPLSAQKAGENTVELEVAGVPSRHLLTPCPDPDPGNPLP